MNDEAMFLRTTKPTSEVTVNDLAVSSHTLAFLREIAAQKGPASTLALFSGPSDTGKTLAAQAIASDIGVDLLVVDSAKIVNKYIGETEKNLSRVTAAAEKAKAVLFFDEADALFGRATASFVLPHVESYRGIVILSVNRKEAIDAALLRRARFVVDFDRAS